MTLTVKQRAKVNAALCIIHDSGLDAQSITNEASGLIAKGHPATAAYERALNAFAADNLSAGAAIGKMVRLIEASDPDTIGKYDQALTQYINTEDNGALLALAPTIATDSVALAIRHGEISATEDPAAAFAVAIGGEPTAIMEQAFTETMAAQAQAAQPTPAEPTGMVQTVSQVSAIEGAGSIGPTAQKARWHFSGFTPDASPFHGLTPTAAREAARSSAAGHGRGYTPATVADAA